MRKLLFFRGIKKNPRVSLQIIACIFMIALLMSACANENKAEMSPLANEEAQLSLEGDIENVEATGNQELICRTTRITGSRFAHKVCATKAQWAKLERKNEIKTDEFQREIKKQTETLDTGPKTDSAGGQTTGPPR